MGRPVAQTVAARLGRACSNSAATTPPSSRRRPISTSRCAPSPSPPWARPASAAPRCAACSCTRAWLRRADAAPEKAYETLPVGDPREAGTLVGPLIDRRRRSTACRRRWNGAKQRRR
jgi:aldehyde dehydrogenase (NAD+)